MSAKYIFVTGGVVSSLGKGLAAASIGCLLESRGLKVNLMKFDPYLNVDPGTMSPFQHGEVFVTDDGAETDLDLGHYERFTHARLSRDNNWTTGRIYEQITAKDVASIYEVPVVFSREGVDTLILRYLHLEAKDRDLKEWDELVHRIYNPKAEVTIGIVGKYVEYEDSYKSLKEALVHGALAHNLKLNLNWIEAEGLETGGSTYEEQLRDYDGSLVHGGFGKGGIEGMLIAIG